AVAVAEPRLHAVQALRVDIVMGRDAELALEQAMKLRRAQAHGLAERGKAGSAALALFERLLDEPAGAAQLLARRVLRRLEPRVAALARAETRALRRFGQREEAHIVGKRPPARAGRAAIDAGGGDAIDKGAIGGARARGDRRPVLLLVHDAIPLTEILPRHIALLGPPFYPKLTANHRGAVTVTRRATTPSSPSRQWEWGAFS